jgi:hypothetical protein
VKVPPAPKLPPVLPDEPARPPVPPSLVLDELEHPATLARNATSTTMECDFTDMINASL